MWDAGNNFLAIIGRPNPILEKFVRTSSNWSLDHNGTPLILQGDEEKSGTIRPAKDEAFTGSSLFLTFTIVTMSRWYLSKKALTERYCWKLLIL
jgi:hypothetical protein